MRAAAAILFCVALAGPVPVAAQGGGICAVSVAFEHLTVRSAIGISNYYHAVVLIGGDAFEGNPSGGFPNWGHLVGRQRSLQAQPLKEAHLQRFAGRIRRGCAEVVAAARGITARLNAARLPYSPTPELAWNAVNSNSCAHYLVRKLGLRPPPPPVPVTSGWVPGYHAAITD